MLYPFLLAVILSIVEFFSEFVAERIKKVHVSIISLNAGIMLCFIFLVVLPELFANGLATQRSIFFFFFAGFLVFHLAEKFVYRHSKSVKELEEELAAVHLFGFYITGVIEGMALFFFRNFIGGTAGALLFVPLLLNSINASVYMVNISKKLWKNQGWLLIPATGPVVGFLMASALATEALASHWVFAFISGALLYVVARDALPDEKKANSELLLIGILVSLMALQIAGLLF